MSAGERCQLAHSAWVQGGAVAAKALLVYFEVKKCVGPTILVFRAYQNINLSF